MSNKSSPRRRAAQANKRYDEDYEYYVPVRNYGKNKNNDSSTAEESETPDTPDVKRKRGRPPGPKIIKPPETETKRVGRPRRYTASTQEDTSTKEVNDPAVEVNILSIVPDSTEPEMLTELIKEDPPQKEKVELGQVLELAVQSMSVTMEEEETVIQIMDQPNEIQNHVEPQKETNYRFTQQKVQHSAPQIKITYESADDQDSDFEWKLENEEDADSHSPPAKKKKTAATVAAATNSNNLITPTNTEDMEEYEEDGEGRIQVRTIVVGEGDGARIECLSCHRIMKPNSLKAHLKTHAHERPHACDLCEARFTRRGDLERHIKVVHNKDRPFKCSKCHRTFGDKKNLRWHLSNHDRKLFHHCQVCGFKFGKREYWENHVRYIHPIPGTDLEPIPADGSMPEMGNKEEASVGTPLKKVDTTVARVNKMLNGNKGSPALVYTKRGAINHRLSNDPFAGLKTPKIVFPPTYWDSWDEYNERTLVLHFRPNIQRYGVSGRPLRRKRVPETTVEIQPKERPDSSFDIDSVPEDQALLDDQTGAFITSSGEVVGYPEEMCKEEIDENNQVVEDEEEEEEEEEQQMEGEIQLDQSGGEGTVLSTHHLVYGEDGQMRLMVGPGRLDGQDNLVEGVYDDEDEDGILRGDLSHAFVESGQIVILQPDGSAVLAPAGGQLVETENGQLILVQTLEDGTQTAVAYATAQDMEGMVDNEGEEDTEEMKTDQSSNQDAVQTLIDAVQELIDNRQKPS